MARRKDAPGNGELPEWFSTVPLDPDHYRAYITGLSEYLGCSEAELEITIDPERWFRRRLQESAKNCPVSSYVPSYVSTVHPADTEPAVAPGLKHRVEIPAPSVSIIGRYGEVTLR